MTEILLKGHTVANDPSIHPPMMSISNSTLSLAYAISVCSIGALKKNHAIEATVILFHQMSRVMVKPERVKQLSIGKVICH